MTRKQRRLTVITVAGCMLALSVGLMLYALSGTIVFFNTPSQLVTAPPPVGTPVRIGGLVTAQSIIRKGSEVEFGVNDTAHDVKVRFKGLLPDLFREGQGVVVEGSLDSHGVFEATSVLAKHDENYMPKEVADALKAQGVWKGDQP
jgi:cytochrome c-type biogenesis protein CcmE